MVMYKGFDLGLIWWVCNLVLGGGDKDRQSAQEGQRRAVLGVEQLG